ncbi:DUF4865 family protein [Lentzea tibetensis]|uniref:DUF4865 family protein n=1 Tax=Lentzea tibetensis TaxID=2591470 RepID=A0A563EXD8_9PSEU|nr:DUF4865 family protein [Lentzea tibetensis]TWP52141.1 DUF4865 family protein [Lentzea tibetensis]
MIAMQYEITLPSDYDMSIIRHRVATRGHLLDDFAGLRLKAYLVRENAPVNQYAPFYVWDTSDGMAEFLYRGGGFQGILASFGRPVVQHWPGVAFRRGTASEARFATRRLVRLGPDDDPITAVAEATEEFEQRADGVHSTVLAVDPRNWEIVHFTLWAENTGEPGWEVLHLSQP